MNETLPGDAQLLLQGRAGRPLSWFDETGLARTPSSALAGRSRA